jgi:hypothetical protein
MKPLGGRYGDKKLGERVLSHWNSTQRYETNRDYLPRNLKRGSSRSKTRPWMTMIQKTMDDICRLSGLAISSPLYDTVHLLLPGMYGTP